MANSIVCSMEENFESDNKMPEFYKRCSRYSVLIWTLNDRHPVISFTKESNWQKKNNNNNKLPFLGMEIFKKSRLSSDNNGLP